MPYDPADPLKDRITDIGPRYFKDFLPPVIKNNFGKWLYHEILEPGVLVHVAESGDEVYTVRVGGCRLMSVEHLREISEIADKHCDGSSMTSRAGNSRRVQTSSRSEEPALVLPTSFIPRDGPTATPPRSMLPAWSRP
jgi:sulfite reductase beta subunit